MREIKIIESERNVRVTIDGVDEIKPQPFNTAEEKGTAVRIAKSVCYDIAVSMQRNGMGYVFTYLTT